MKVYTDKTAQEAESEKESWKSDLDMQIANKYAQQANQLDAVIEQMED